MANETALRKYIAEKIHGHVSQLESHATAAGVPDTNYCINGTEGWIEMKFTRGNKKFKYRGTQKAWFRDRLKAGTKNLFILWRREDGAPGTGRTHGIIHMNTAAKQKRVFSDTSPSVWEAESLCVWEARIPEMHLNMILENKHG